MSSMQHPSEQPLVSVCVPIYNVAPYIEQCVRSLMEQDYTNIEYVFVNDGSTDDSMMNLEKAIDAYPQRHNQVCIYTNNTNRGSAYSRRRLIENAHGEYICFVDSDDWVEQNYVSFLVEQMLPSKADIVSIACYEHVENKTTITCRPAANNFGEAIQDICSNRVWTKLIKRTLFADGNCLPPDGMNILEDRYLLTTIRYYNPKEVVCPEPLYHYRFHRSGSLTDQKTDYTFQCQLLFYKNLLDFLEDKPDKDRWEPIIHRQQISDKAELMLYCNNEALRKKYADAYQPYEWRYLWTLRGSFFIVLFLIHFRCWKLLSAYQIYINWRIRTAK